MQKKPHSWEKLYCCFKINYMQTLSLTWRDLKKKKSLKRMASVKSFLCFYLQIYLHL